MINSLSVGMWKPLAALSLVLSMGACAEQGVPSSTPMQLGASTLAPRGYLQFCLRRPDQCGLNSPLTQIHDDAFQAALNREEWSNVMSLGRGSAKAPAATVVDTNVVEARVVEVKAEASVPEAVLIAAPDLAPSEAAPASVSLPVTVDIARLGGAPTLDQLFQSVRRAPAEVLHYTPQLWSHLETVNIEINERIRPRTDVEAFGVDDYWTLPLDVGGRAEGNCKHYALEKRRALVEGGMSEDALSLAILRTPQGETHAVLIVATDRGDFVLDNLTPEIRGWRDTGYTWLSRQAPGEPLRWAKVDLYPRTGR